MQFPTSERVFIASFMARKQAVFITLQRIQRISPVTFQRQIKLQIAPPTQVRHVDCIVFLFGTILRYPNEFRRRSSYWDMSKLGLKRNTQLNCRPKRHCRMSNAAKQMCILLNSIRSSPLKTMFDIWNTDTRSFYNSYFNLHSLSPIITQRLKDRKSIKKQSIFASHQT